MTDGPMSSWDLEVSRADLSVIRVVSGTQPLGEGEVLLAVERLAVTANILTYASLGDELGYWRLFPAAPGWGRIPAWGHAVVVGSRRPDFDLGARYFGMFPMSSHVAAKPRRTRHGFADDEPSRRSLSAVYNQYFDTGRQTLVAMENAALFRPLIVASFVLDAYLREVAFFGARQVVVTSASSKTALGLAMLLEGVIPTVGATSSDRLDFVEKAGVYALVCAYGNPGAIDREKKTLIVDFAGDDQLLATLRTEIGTSVARVCRVGGTHWRAATWQVSAPDVEVFFAPAHIERLVGEWGAARFEDQLTHALDEFAEASSGWFSRTYADGREGLSQAYRDLIARKIDPSQLVIARPNPG